MNNKIKQIEAFMLAVGLSVLLAGCIHIQYMPSKADSSLEEQVQDGIVHEKRIQGGITIDTPELYSDRTDYSDKANWIQIPEIENEADTFYICGTAYMTTDPEDPLCCDIDDPDMRKGAIKKLKSNKGIFEEATNVFAPFYRQASVYALQDLDGDAAEEFLMGEPGNDIYAALDYYFENYNEGRPFILAGYSQGSMILRIVLKNYMKEHPEYYERMIAAYPIGYSITEGDLKECPYLKFAEGPDDTGVIISFNTEGEGNVGSRLVLDGAISINPINWKRDETYAPASENLGTKITDSVGTEGIASPGVADARVDTKRGVVICTNTDYPYIDTVNNLGLEKQIFGEKSFHGSECFFYFENLRENVVVRVESYLREKGSH